MGTLIPQTYEDAHLGRAEGWPPAGENDKNSDRYCQVSDRLRLLSPPITTATPISTNLP